MVMASLSLREDYWESLELEEQDIETIYNYLLESEMPMTSWELIEILVQERIRSEKLVIEQQRSSGGEMYLPAEVYQVDQMLVFPALNWQKARVIAVRPGRNPDVEKFDVIKVSFEDGDEREYAAGLEQHKLNDLPALEIEDEKLDAQYVLDNYDDDLVEILEENLETNPDFVRIAGRWFPRALLVDINIGHLNLAEAVLDMAAGGPLPTSDLLNCSSFQWIWHCRKMNGLMKWVLPGRCFGFYSGWNLPKCSVLRCSCAILEWIMIVRC
jgi:hypothetical protein